MKTIVIFSVFILFLFLPVVNVAAKTKKCDEVTIENRLLKVSVSSLGAELKSLFYKPEKAEYLWQGDSTYWENRAPLMFPVNIRFRDDKFTYKGKEYKMPRMGLLMHATFKTLKIIDKNSISMEFSSTPEILKNNFPFPFRFVVTYTLDKNKLVCRFDVSNTGKETMLFTVGAHPGFNCPFTNGKKRSDYQFDFMKKVTISRPGVKEGVLVDTVIPILKNERVLNLADKRVANTGMFIEKCPSKEIGIGEAGKEPYVIVHSTDFSNINLWSRSTFPFACIETLLTHHDYVDTPYDIEQKGHLVPLAPGKSKSYRFIIEIKGKNQHSIAMENN